MDDHVTSDFRHFGPAFRDHHGASLSRARRRAMSAIEICRTAALGGRVERCDDRRLAVHFGDRIIEAQVP